MKHEFALFVPDLDLSKPELVLSDDDLASRIMHVLRMQSGEKLVLFDRAHVASVSISHISKKSISVQLHAQQPIQALTPAITLLLPVLKREAFEQVLYSAAELGVTTIQTLTTAKATQSWGSEKDLARAERIFIAAAEQSKQFSLPIITPSIPFEKGMQTIQAQPQIFFDASGKPLPEVLQSVFALKPSALTCLLGPEGDLSQSEKDLVNKAGFISCRLTPTVLRAPQAMALGVGVLRSWMT